MSDEQIRRVWEGLLTSEILANYFAELANGYHRRQRLTTWAALVLSSGTLVSLLLSVPDNWVWLRPFLALLTAGISAYSVAVQNQKLATDSADLYAKWDKLASEFQAIWENVHADDALQRLFRCEETQREISKAATAFPNREKRMLKWQAYVEERHRASATA
ncbi:MAG: hypothetical protein HY822_19265 [Acidobacteria bacterium]|nr:hypothetical protein [Acidobacteriota bacterium]